MRKMTPTPPNDPTERPAVQDPDPPDLDLVERAARRLRQILNDPDRSTADKRRAIDALGRALLRLKASL
jgi:hypothetical protein